MVKTAETYHVPVLLQESIDGLNIKSDGIYVDVTFGGGGHSREILSRLGKNGHLYSFDQDADAEKNIIADDRFTFVRSNFRYLRNWMRYYGVEAIDGLLADLGVSSHHFDDETRGFSFRFDAPLDMRMNKRAGKTAADIVNEYDEAKLADVFFLYGELKNSRRIANAIVTYRQQKRIETTGDLMAATEKLMRTEKEKKRPRTSFTGTAHRGQPRDGRPAGYAQQCQPAAQERWTAECHHLPLTGRSHCEECDEGRQC